MIRNISFKRRIISDNNYRYLATINSFTEALNKVDSIDDIVKTITNHAIKILGFQDCSVFLFDEKTNALIQKATQKEKDKIHFFKSSTLNIELGQGIVGYVAFTGIPEIVPNTTNDNRYILDNGQAMSQLSVPIIDDYKVIGVIDSKSKTSNFYSLQDLETLKTIASIAAGRIKNAKMNKKLSESKEILAKKVEEKTLELQNTLANLRKTNEEIILSNKRIQRQKDFVEKVYKELYDSISYAKRIQDSFKSNYKLINENFSDYFILHRSKEIVSGDFIWINKLVNGHIGIVNGDSTGHGVPGAMMSILNIHNIELALDQNFVKPENIFNFVRLKLINRLYNDDNIGGNDGMDATMITFDPETMILRYAAAQAPIYLFREGKLKVITPEKMPVGKHRNDIVPFKGGELKMKTDDRIYLFTDGYCDQFGGPKGKKFGKTKFKNLLQRIHQFPMHQQKAHLMHNLKLWKANLEQVDDISILGLKI